MTEPDAHAVALEVIAGTLQHVLDWNARIGNGGDEQQIRSWPEYPSAAVVKRWVESLRSAAKEFA